MKIKFLAGIVALLALIMSCAEQPPKQLSNKTVDRPRLSHWYDSTYLEYYDAYGPVRSIVNRQQKTVFNRNGRLLSQLSQDGDGDFEVRYAYHDDGRLDRITSYRNGGEYRLSEYHYDEDNKLRQVRFLDYGSGQQFHSKHKIQPLKSGWFAVDIPVEQIDLPLYKQFDDRGQLMWSSQSGFNHGVGRHFSLPVGDSVFSSRVVNEYTLQMHGVGGYGYDYDERGRLWKVTSFNDNDLDVYHTTTYSYNAQGLIETETKRLLGKSLFNDSLNPEQAQIQTVNYRYLGTDRFGNWTYRTVIVNNRAQQSRYDEQRHIEYFGTINAKES